MICPKSGTEMKMIPAGVSKSTGRPYPAFQACGVKGCDHAAPQQAVNPEGWRPYTPPPPSTTAAPGTYPHPNAPPTGESKDRQIARAVALKASVNMYVGAMGAGLAKDDIPEAFVIQRAETFLGWLEGKDEFEKENGF